MPVSFPKSHRRILCSKVDLKGLISPARLLWKVLYYAFALSESFNANIESQTSPQDMTTHSIEQVPLSMRRIVNTWWPLAASWMLMGLELPVVSAVIARHDNPEINLAAYGGIIFPLALIIEAPVIMLLAASTALCKDWDSYVKVRRFMMAAGASLTALHVLVAFTPLYYLVVEGLIGAPQEIVGPARIGLMIMTPWTWSIAYRRFNQGILIRFGHSGAVGAGTVVRLGTNWLVLAGGVMIGGLPGIVVGTTAVAVGVVSEALYVGMRARPVVENELKPAPPVPEPITLPSFLSFYIPLAMTSLLFLLALPIGSAALSRMPLSLASLAVWPVITGLIFMLRSLGMAYNEVVVALLDEPFSSPGLRKFAVWLAGLTSGGLTIVAITPLSLLWFAEFSALDPELTALGKGALWLALPIPALSVLQSWFQGAIVFGRKTRGITEAVVIYLVMFGSLSIAGVIWGRTAGLYIGMATLMLSMLMQTIWLWYRSQPIMHLVKERDSGELAPPSAAGLSLSE